MGKGTLVRGAISLAVLGGLVGALIASPAGAFDPGDKRKVKKISKNQATALVNQLTPGIATTVAAPLAGRFAFARDNDQAVAGPANNAVVVSTSITAPTNGHLAISAGSDVNGGPDLDTCILQVDGTRLLSTERTIELGTGNTEEDCSTQGAVAVTAGAHTVDLIADNPNASVEYDEAVLWVIFVPFDGTGTVPGVQSIG